MVKIKNLKPAAKVVWKWAKKHAPKILAGVAIVSNGFGYYFMHKEAPKVHEKLDKLDTTASMWDKIKCYGPYWPAMLMYITSTGSTVGAVIVGDKIAAGWAALCSLSKAELDRTQQQLLEAVGPEKMQEMNEKGYQEIAKKTYPIDPRDIENTGYGDVLFCDPMTGRWFRSSVPAVEGAKNDYNDILQSHGAADWNDFYDCLNIKGCDFNGAFGHMRINGDEKLDYRLVPSERAEDRELYYTIDYFYNYRPTACTGKPPRTIKESYNFLD